MGGDLPEYVPKTLIAIMTFSIIFGGFCSFLALYIPALAGVSVPSLTFQQPPVPVYDLHSNATSSANYTDSILLPANETWLNLNATALGQSYKIVYNNAYSDYNQSIILDCNNTWVNFNNALMGQSYQAAFNNIINASEPRISLMVNAPSPPFGWWVWDLMNQDLNSYTYDRLNVSTIISNWNPVNNWTSCYYRNDPAGNQPDYDVYCWFRDWNGTRNNVTASIWTDLKINMTIMRNPTGVWTPRISLMVNAPAPPLGLYYWDLMNQNLDNYTYNRLNVTTIVSHWDATNNWTSCYYRNDPSVNQTDYDVFVYYRDWNTTRNNVVLASIDGQFNVTLSRTPLSGGTALPAGFNGNLWNIPAVSGGAWYMFGADYLASVAATIGYGILYAFLAIGWFLTQVGILFAVLLAPYFLIAGLGGLTAIFIALPLSIIDSVGIYCLAIYIRSIIPW